MIVPAGVAIAVIAGAAIWYAYADARRRADERAVQDALAEAARGFLALAEAADRAGKPHQTIPPAPPWLTALINRHVAARGRAGLWVPDDSALLAARVWRAAGRNGLTDRQAAILGLVSLDARMSEADLDLFAVHVVKAGAHRIDPNAPPAIPRPE